MIKLNRNINNDFLEAAKNRMIDNVMDRIVNNNHNKKTFFISMKTFVLSIAVLIVVSLSFVFFYKPSEPNPIQLNEYLTENIVEASYITGNLISYGTSNISNVSQGVTLAFQPIDNSSTKFETNIDDFNNLFDMLKAFIDNDVVNDTVSVEYLVEQEYDVLVSYLIDGILYDFYLTVIDTDIQGLLVIGSKNFTVTGKLENKDDEFKISIKATYLNDYIEIDYSTEGLNENEKKYEIKQNINGIYQEKEIKIEKDLNETKVEVVENENEYKLELRTLNNQTIYHLEYNMNNIEGEAIITEVIGIDGVSRYHYDIDEDGIEIEIELDDPNEDEEIDDEDEEDEEDEEEIDEEDDETEDEEDDEEQDEIED